MADPLPSFHCPGEHQAVSWSIHLGRLARFYPACRTCPHRDATGTLSSEQVELLHETRMRTRPAELFSEEGLEGFELNQIDPPTARRAAGALGLYLQERQGADESFPTVVIASDARPLAADLIEAAAEGLRLSGCNVIDVGGTTTACMTDSLGKLDVDGALFIGNAAGGRHTVSLRFWGRHGQPISKGHELEAISRLFHGSWNRPTRRFGSLRRLQIDEDYLKRVQPFFHALRPLHVRLDSRNAPLLRYLNRLTHQVTCEFVTAATNNERASSSVHFGMWIDGDGEVCRFWDESGLPVKSENVLLALAQYSLSARSGAMVILEDSTPDEVAAQILKCGGGIIRSGASRAAMDQAMRKSGALIGGGSSGRFWFAGKSPSPDGLEVLARLLALLSQSDRPLSEVLASDILAA